MTIIGIDLLGIALGFGFTLLIMWSGVGAGVLVIPALVSVFQMDPVQAIATGSSFAFFSKIAMTVGHTRGGQIDWNIGKQFLLWCLPITVFAGTLMVLLSKSGSPALLHLVIMLLIICAGMFALASIFSSHIGHLLSLLSLRTLSIATGSLMGLTGVGGGILVVPALMTSGGLSARTAVATSIPIGLILSLAVSLTLSSGGFVNWNLVLALCIGTFVAVPVGVRAFAKFSDKVIRNLTSALIAIALADLIVESFHGFEALF